MSHHLQITIKGIHYGHLRITNEGQILSVWVNQPWGEGELLKSIHEEIPHLEEDDGDGCICIPDEPNVLCEWCF